MNAVIGSLSPVGLPHVPELLDRRDRKYLVPVETFPAFISLLGPRLRVLEIDGLRTFRYDSMYFDTPGLLTYHQHLQRRRRRYKVRTRAYLDSGDCMLEVKLNGTRDATAKRRTPLPLDLRDRLTRAGFAFVDGVLARTIGTGVPGLEPTLRTAYRRTTLVAADGSARYTCDTDLQFSSGKLSARGPSDHVLVEVKTERDRDPADRVLRGLGIRPVVMSKYPVGVAVLWPGIRANPWRRTIQHYFSPRKPVHHSGRAEAGRTTAAAAGQWIAAG